MVNIRPDFDVKNIAEKFNDYFVNVGPKTSYLELPKYGKMFEICWSITKQCADVAMGPIS